MSDQAYDNVIAALKRYVASRPDLSLNEVAKSLLAEINQIAEDGGLSLGSDKDLTGDALEIRVRLLLRSIGLAVSRGRPGLEDLIITAPVSARTRRPLVVEVKSDRKPSVKRDDLRQLDDWVFDLSGEEVARKEGLGGGIDAVAMVTGGMMTGTHHHPSPHKGVFVFNAPIGVPFEDRKGNAIGPDEVAFAAKRGFCLVPFGTLMAKIEAVKRRTITLDVLWEQIQACEGELA